MKYMSPWSSLHVSISAHKHEEKHILGATTLDKASNETSQYKRTLQMVCTLRSPSASTQKYMERKQHVLLRECHGKMWQYLHIYMFKHYTEVYISTNIDDACESLCIYVNYLKCVWRNNYTLQNWCSIYTYIYQCSYSNRINICVIYMYIHVYTWKHVHM